MSGSLASIRRTASPIIGWSSISRAVILCWVKLGSMHNSWFFMIIDESLQTNLGETEATCQRSRSGAPREPLGDDRGNRGDRKHLDGGADLGSNAGHAPDDAGGLVLRDGQPAAAAELQQ